MKPSRSELCFVRNFKITNPISCYRSFSLFFRVLFPQVSIPSCLSSFTILLYSLYQIILCGFCLFVCLILPGLVVYCFIHPWLYLLILWHGGSIISLSILVIFNYEVIFCSDPLSLGTPCDLNCKVFLQKCFVFVPAGYSKELPQETVKFRLCACPISQAWAVNFSWDIFFFFCSRPQLSQIPMSSPWANKYLSTFECPSY